MSTPSEPLVLERRDTLRTRLYGLLFTVLPGGLGALLLLRPGGFLARVAGAAGVAIAVFVARGALRFADRVELTEGRLRVRSMWTHLVRELDLERLVGLRIRFAMPPEGDRRLPEPVAFDLAFEGGGRLFLGPDFPGAERLAERAIAAHAEGLALPLRLGRAPMTAWLRYAAEPRLGCSAGYVAEGSTLTVYTYRGAADRVPDGALSHEVEGEMKRACDDIQTLAARQAPPAPLREVDRGLVGDDGGLPLRFASFELGEGERTLATRVYLTGHGGQFLKARFTGPTATADRLANEMLTALAWNAARGPAPS